MSYALKLAREPQPITAFISIQNHITCTSRGNCTYIHTHRTHTSKQTRRARAQTYTDVISAIARKNKFSLISRTEYKQSGRNDVC